MYINLHDYTAIAIAIFMLMMGLGMAIIWAIDMAKGKFSHMGHFFRWTNDGGDLMWPHIIAEYLTAAGLIAAGMGTLAGLDWAPPLSLVMLGALCYTSLNSLSWVFANKERLPYGIPMMVSLVGGILAIALLLQ